MINQKIPELTDLPRRPFVLSLLFTTGEASERVTTTAKTFSLALPLSSKRIRLTEKDDEGRHH